MRRPMSIPFYQKFGFVEHGKEFMDAGMPHKKMKLKLTSPAIPVRYSSSLKFITASGWNTVKAVISMPVVKASVSMMMGVAMR